MGDPEAQELLTANLAVVERAVAFAARRYGLDPADAEKLEAAVKSRLVENDYAILRAYEKRSSFATFISIVVQRMALDGRIDERWRTSQRVSSLPSGAIAGLPDADRLVLQLRFEGGMTVAQIARSLGLDRKLTCRQIERNTREIRRELEHAAAASGDAADLTTTEDSR